MPRKTGSRSTPASSASAAAAVNSNTTTTPTFTSFAAATAQVLASQSSDRSSLTTTSLSAPTTTTAWDEEALTIVKKLSKRDTTTKTRALTDLTEHILSSKLPPDAGSSFLSAWTVTFPSLLDDSPGVSTGALHAMRAVVSVLGRRMTQMGVLQQLFPFWIGATGDSSSIVTEAAINGIDDVFPSSEKKDKVARRFGNRICVFCNQYIAKLRKSGKEKKKKDGFGAEEFDKLAKRVVAALRWLLDATKDVNAISSVLDNRDESGNIIDFLHIIVKGPKGSNNGDIANKSMSAKNLNTVAPTREVADLAIDIVRLTTLSKTTMTDTTIDEDLNNSRLQRVVDLACMLGRVGDYVSWDIFIVLLSHAPDIVMPVFDKMAAALSTVAAKGDVAALEALLPVMGAVKDVAKQHPEMIYTNMARKLLSPMRKRLFLDEKEVGKGGVPSTASILQIFPAYVEAVAQVLAGLTIDDNGSEHGSRDHIREWATDFAQPACEAFVAGDIPPIMNHAVRNEGVFMKRSGNRNVNGKMSNLVACMASLVRIITMETPDILGGIADSLVLNLSKRDRTQTLERFSQLLDSVADPVCEGRIAKAAIQRIVNFNEDESSEVMLSNSLHVASVILSKRAGNMLLSSDVNSQSDVHSIVCDLISTVRVTLSSLSLSIKKGDAMEDEDSGDKEKELTTQVDDIESVVPHFGVVYSWILWASSSIEIEEVATRVFDDIRNSCIHNDQSNTESQERTFRIIGQLVHAHERRRKQLGTLSLSSSTKSSPICHPLPVDHVEEFVHKAVEVIDNGTVAKPFSIITAVIRLMTTCVQATAVSTKCVDQIVAAVATGIVNMRSMASCNDGSNDGSSDDIFDELIIALLRFSNIGHGKNEVLMETAFKRATVSKNVMDSFVARVSSLPATEAVTLITSLFTTTDSGVKAVCEIDDGGGNIDVGRHRVGVAMARLVSELGERDVKASVLVCKQLCTMDNQSVDAGVVLSLMKHVSSPLYVFGEDVTTSSLLMFSILKFNDSEVIDAMMSHMPDYLETCLEKDVLKPLVVSITEAVLDGTCCRAIEIMKIICKLENESSTLQSIAGRIERAVPFSVPGSISNTSTPEEKEKKKKFFQNVSKVVHACVLATNGRFVHYLEDAMADITSLIRRDPVSDVAFIGMDIICASADLSLSNKERKNEIKTCKWFEETVKVIMRATRRCLEVPRGITKQDVEKLEAYGAAIMFYSMNSFGRLGRDDVWFWRLRLNDALAKFLEQHNHNGRETSEVECKRIAWMCRLADVLLDDDGNDNTDAVNTVQMDDEICHSGAWCTAYILPKFDQLALLLDGPDDGYGFDHQMMMFDKVNGDGCARLIVKAAERGVLLGKDGGFPVDRDLVYAVVPWLKSKRNDIRTAVFALVAHFAAVDLPEIVMDSFPTNGFKKEEDEEAYAERIIPREVRDGLEWDERCTEIGAHEIGFFLCWRLFLDLMHGHDLHASRQEEVEDGKHNNEVEEVSVRRVAVTYLRRRRPGLFGQFLAQCVDVAVDGSEMERRAATNAVQESLKVEERSEAQGFQLVKQQEEKEKRRQQALNNDEDSGGGTKRGGTYQMEEHVGRAAGIAFGRALQHVPALSREALNDGLAFDRGTLTRVEEFVRKRISPVLIAAEIIKVREWGSFGGGSGGGNSSATTAGIDSLDDEDGQVEARGSVAGREVWATYKFSDVILEMAVRLPETFPLQTAVVQDRSKKVGMTERRWRKTVLGMTTLFQVKDGCVAEAVEVWRRNLDETFKGKEECPICYSVLHLATAALPKMQCRTCRKLFHSDCLCKWFTKSNSSACPLCRSAF